jgi:hypothetical protein
MRASIAYFVGAGTVVAAIAAGLGGGLLMANIMNPHEVREASKVERRAQQAQQSPQPDSRQGTSSTVAASNTPQAPTAYQAAIQQSATTPVVVAPAPSNSPQPSSEASNVGSPPAQPSPPREAAAANETQSAPSASKAADASVLKQREKPQEKPQEQASTQPAVREEQAAVQPASREQASPPDNAYAKARDADVKRQAAEQRRAERRQQWTTRRQPRDQELRDVEAKVREDSDSREVIVERDDFDQPRFSDPDRPRNRDFDRSRRSGGPIGFPSINLFGPD